MTSSIRELLVILLIIAAAGRFIWILQFLLLSITNRTKSWWRQVLEDTLLPASARGNAEQALQRFNLYFTHQVAAYTLGGLALTAWTVLLATHASTPSDRFTLAMLGFTVIVGIGSSVVFRVAGGEMTRMGYESGLAIASVALVFAMESLLLGTFGSTWTQWLVRVGSCILVVRDLIETFRQMQITASAIAPAARVT